MTATLSVNLRNLSGSVDLEVPEGSTIADVRAAAAEAGQPIDGLNIRADGNSAADDQQVRDEQVLVATPPAAKHG